MLEDDERWLLCFCCQNTMYLMATGLPVLCSDFCYAHKLFSYAEGTACRAVTMALCCY